MIFEQEFNCLIQKIWIILKIAHIMKSSNLMFRVNNINIPLLLLLNTSMHNCVPSKKYENVWISFNKFRHMHMVLRYIWRCSHAWPFYCVFSSFSSSSSCPTSLCLNVYNEMLYETRMNMFVTRFHHVAIHFTCLSLSRSM